MSIIPALRTDHLEVRLAASPAEIDAGQSLRYRVFYGEMGAMPTPEMRARERDFDQFDAYCDHLLVIDHRRGSGAAGVVGTYRMLRRERADAIGRFYSADEYDISPLLNRDLHLLEVGRSCVDADHRSTGTMQMLWRGIAAYIFHHKVDLLFGCASLPGTNPDALALPLSYLHHHHLAPAELRPRALSERYTDMNRLPPDAVSTRAALASLPPLVKGYLRLGGFVGEGAVIDHQFNTTDVCVLVKTDLVTRRYLRHYDRDRVAMENEAETELE